VFSNGNGSAGGGFRIAPAAGGTSKGVIDRVVADRNTFGLAADASGGSVSLNINDTTVTNATLAAIVGTAGSGTANVMVMRSTASNSATGIQNAGGTTTIRVGQSAIQGNTTGVSGAVSSYTTNQLNGNGTDGTMSGIPLK
jgi:hypothetical protein